jgi:hypothetical protein
MHFHLPKPLHGWREFAGEVGIIVVGVLIALAAEQVVEAAHWREQMRETREELNSEAQQNLAAVKWRLQQQPCLDRRLAEIGEIFRRHAAGGQIKLDGRIGRPVFFSGSQTGWQIAVSSQALSHMSFPEKTQLANAFDNYQNFTEVLKREQDAWLRLGVLDHPEQLSDGDWPVLHQADAEATMLGERMKIITQFVLTRESLGEAVGMPPRNAAADAAVRVICAPVLAGNIR